MPLIFQPGEEHELPILSWGPGREGWRFLTPWDVEQKKLMLQMAEQVGIQGYVRHEMRTFHEVLRVFFDGEYEMNEEGEVFIGGM